MNRRRKRLRNIRQKLSELSSIQVLTRSAFACALLIALVFVSSIRRIESLPISDAPFKFDAHRAFGFMSDLSKKFPNRVTWSEQRKKAGRWIKEELNKMGYESKGMHFSEVIAGKQYTDLENVYAEKKGTTFPNEIIVLMAHYDITDTTVEGAMDNASGVGVVMEMARVLAKENTQRTVIFLLTDSEEFGAFWGARAFAAQFPRVHQIVAALNFDFVTAEKQTKILTLCDGLKEGFTPLWLREIAMDSLRSVGGVKVTDMIHFGEWAERAMQIPPGDHGAFLAAGIPTLTWVGQSDNFSYVMAHYHHTHHDRVEAMRPESFVPYGRGAERAVRSIDALPSLPENPRDGNYWKITQYRYITGGGALLIHILLFVPFLAFCFTKFSRTVKRTSRIRILAVLRNEAKKVGIMLGSLVLGYAIMMLLPALDVVTLYETFPATQKSKILYTPNLLAIVLVFGGIGVIYLVLRKVFSAREDTSQEYHEIRQALHSALLALTVTLAFAKNSYLACLMLLPPCYLWTQIRARRRPGDRILNTLLLAGGTLSMVALMLVFATIFHIGVIYWYMFLAATYGLFSAYAVVVFLVTLTIMIRLFRAYVI